MSELQSELLIHADDVWRIVIRLVGNEDDARDCYQETFADALRIPSGTAKDWRRVLRRIATRRAMDTLRRRYRDRNYCEAYDEEPSIESPPDTRVQFQELRDKVREILARLPPAQAEAFFMRHIEQMDPIEIANQMQIQPNHVRVLVHRALSQVRRSLPSTFQPPTFQPEPVNVTHQEKSDE